MKTIVLSGSASLQNEISDIVNKLLTLIKRELLDI